MKVLRFVGGVTCFGLAVSAAIAAMLPANNSGSATRSGRDAVLDERDNYMAKVILAPVIAASSALGFRLLRKSS